MNQDEITEALSMADEAIEDLRKHIQWSVDAMNAGLPVFDIEEIRLKLAKLKKYRAMFVERFQQ